MRWLLLLAASIVICSAHVFKFEAHHAEITHHNLKHFETRHSHVKKAEKIFEEKIASFLNDPTAAVTVKHIEIHGVSANSHTAIINGFLDTKVNRDEITERFQEQPDADLKLYYVEQIDVVPSVDLSHDEVLDAVSSCKNGGVLFPNATCACPPFYTGSQCETIVCLNGGILCEEGKCMCPPGFQSEHCESRSCSPSTESSLDMSTSTLFYVVSLKDTMALDLNSLIPATRDLLNKLNTAYPGYIQNYVLTKVLQSKSGTYMKTEFFTDSAAFYKSLMMSMISTGTDAQPLIAAMNQTVQSYDAQRPKSFLYVFTDSQLSDYKPIDHSLASNSVQNSLVKTLLYWHIRPFFVISDVNLDATTLSYKTISWLIATTHGDIIVCPKSDVGYDATDIISLHVNVENVFVANYIKCSDVAVSVNPAMKTVYAYVYGGVALGGAAGTFTELPVKFTLGTLQVFPVDTTKYDTVSARVDPQNYTAGYCGIRIWESSTISVLNGFATNVAMDNGNIYSVAGMPAILNVGVLNGAPKKVTFKALNSYNDTATSDPKDLTQKSIGCTMGWQVDTAYQCTAGPFTGQIDLQLDSGIVTRAVPSYCFTSPPVKPASLVCLNGGRPFAGVCQCTQYWTGNVCQAPICSNGGFANVFPGNGQPLCICPTGFLGDHCNVLKCNQTTTDELDVSTRTLAVVVRTSYSMAAFGQYISGALDMMVQRAQPGYYAEYVMTTFNAMDKNTTFMNVTKYTDAKSFHGANNLQYSFSSGGDQPVMTAIWETMGQISLIRSAIFVFVDAPMVSKDNRTMDDVKEFAISQGLRLNFIIVDPYQNKDQCLQASDITTYQDLAFSTGGVVLNLCHEDNDYSKLYNFLGDYATTYDYQMETNYLKVADCSKGVDVPFHASHQSQHYFIVANSATQSSFKGVLTDDRGSIAVTSISPISTLGLFNVTNYQGNVTVNIKGQGTGSCFIRVLEQSQLPVFLAFSPNPQVDRQDINPLLEQALYPVIRMASALQSVPAVTVTAWEKNGNEVKYSSNAVTRQQSCGYDQYALAPFACDTPNEEFFVQVTLNTPEIIVTRTLRSFCRVLVTTCLNNGKWNTTTSKCDCLPKYMGKNCEIKQCQNGATFHNGICNCAPMFNGEFCEFGMCNVWDFPTTHNSEAHKFRTIAFALEKSEANKFAYSTFGKNIQTIVENIEQVDVNTQLALVVYDDKDISLRVLTPHIDVFVDAVKKACEESTKDITTAITFDAVQQVHNLIASPNAQNPALINVLMASPSNNPTTLNSLRAREGTQVNFIYNTPASSDVSVLKNNFDALYQLAYQSGGRFLPVLPATAAQKLDKIFSSFIRQNGLIADASLPDCTGGLTIEFPVEASAKELVLEFVAYSAIGITVTDGAGKAVTIPFANKIYSDRQSAIYRITSNDTFATLPGIWTFSVKSASGRCQLQARVHSPLHVVLGFTVDEFSDFPYAAPFAEYGKNKTSYVTAQVLGLTGKMAGTTLSAIDVYAKNYEKGNVSQIASQGLLSRDTRSCANQFISYVPMSFDTTSHLQLITEGTDPSGSAFKRLNIFSHDYVAPECQNGGKLSDYGYCACADNYDGATCTLPICQNGGTRVGQACLCPNSYYGSFCESHL